MTMSSRLRAPLRALTALFAATRGRDTQDLQAQAMHAAAASAAAYEQHAAGRRDSDRSPTAVSAATLAADEAQVAALHSSDPTSVPGSAR